MPLFKYFAKDTTGRDLQGTIDAANANQVVGELKKQGLIVINVESTSDTSAGPGGLGQAVRSQKRQGTRKPVKVRDLAVMCRQLGTMLKAGLPLIDALETIGTETSNLNLGDAVQRMRDDIEGGSTFSEAINRHPKIFSIMFRAMIEAGEASGSLAQIIIQLATTLKKQDSLNRKIKSATMYPKFVFIFFMGIVAVVLVFLIPNFEGIFNMFARPCKICSMAEEGKTKKTSTGYAIPASAPRGLADPNTGVYENEYTEGSHKYWQGVPKEYAGAKKCPRCDGAGKKAPLPAMTQVLVKISRFITGNILIVLAIVIAFIVLWKQYSNSDTGKRQIQGFLLKVPVVGSMMVKSATAKFSLSLSTLLHNGVPLDQALDITGRVSGNYLLAKSTEQIRESIIQGFALAESMAIHPIFPELIVKMVAVGEESGALAEMLSDIAEYYDEEVTQAVEGVSSIIEPVMIILIGAVVAVIVLGLYLPIFNMGNAMQGKT